MARYRGNVEAIKGLVRETEVHRDVYIDEEVFQLEMEHVFANTWAYVGHDSQVRETRRLLWHHHRHPADPDGAPHRQHRQSPA